MIVDILENFVVVVFGQVMINLIENRHNRIKNHLHNCFFHFRIKIVIDFVLLFVVVVVDYILVVIVFLTIIPFIF